MCPDPELLSVYFDGELPDPWKTRLEEHLASCPRCAKKTETYRLIRAASLPEGDEGPVLEAARERVRARLEAAFSPASGPAFSRADAARQRPVPALWRRSVAVPLPAAAAAVLAVAALVLALLRGGPAGGGPTSGGAREPAMAGVSGQNVPGQMAAFSLDAEEIVPATDMNGVLQYLGSDTGTDFVIIRLPENRHFTSAGQPAIIKAADYPGRPPK